MKVFFRYLRHNLKNSTLRSIIFTVLSILFVMVQLPDLITPLESPGSSNPYRFCRTGLNLLATILGIFSTIMPFLCLSDFKNRRNSDTLYSFPISRFKMSLVHFISGFIQTIFVYTCTFFVYFFVLLAKTDCFDLTHLLLYFPLSLLTGLAIYCFFSFFFTKGNTLTDGVVLSFLWFLTIYLFVIFIGSEILIEHRIFGWGMIYSPLDYLTVIFMKRAEINYIGYHNDYIIEHEHFYMFIVWAMIAIVCAIGFFISATKYKSNKAGELSDSFFAYKLIIPIFSILITYELFYVTSISAGISTAITMFILYAIYRRSFKLRKSDFIVMIATIVFNVLITYFLHDVSIN